MSAEATPLNAVVVEPAAIERRLWTYSELLATLPESNRPIELWDGEVIVTPAPTPQHQEISMRLERRLVDFVAAHHLGKVYHAPLDVILAEYRVVQPDILFIANDNLSIIQDRVRGVPDLVVEIVSPGTWHLDRLDKRALYEQYGVREYWIVDPEAATVEVLAWEEGTFRLHGRFAPGDRASSALLPGFEIAVDELLGR